MKEAMDLDNIIGYLIGDLSHKIMHPTHFRTGKKIIYDPSDTHRTVRLKTYDVTGGLIDALVTHPGRLFFPDRTPKEDFDIVDLWSKNPEGYNEYFLTILASEIPLYIQLGVLVPLDRDGMLAHQYGIL